MREPAPAKINLTLHVLGRRPDGLHDLDSLVAFAAVHDVLSVSVADEFSLTVDGPFAAALAGTPPGDNLALRAARAAVESAGSDQAFAVHLTKNLPVAAGLGGGSADAAAVLRAAARILGLAPSSLFPAAANLGADVPVCLASRTMHMAGAGGRLTPAPALPTAPLALVCPPVPVPTRDVFARWLLNPALPTPPIPAVQSVQALAIALHHHGNDLTSAALSVAPIVADVLRALADQPGCLLARMSGSGPACFGLFPDSSAAAAAAARISAARPKWWLVASQIAAPEVFA